MTQELLKKLKNLSDADLLSEMKLKVINERRATLEVLQYLKEVDLRRLHLERGYPSLFEFCVKYLGYSESSAQRRISSMRLLRDLPEVEEKLKDATVNLSTLSQLQSHIRREEKVSGSKFSKDEKRELLSLIENKSQNDSQVELLKVSTEPFVALEKERVVSPEHVEIKFIANQELMKKLRELKNLHAHKLKNLGWAELFEMLADELLKNKGSTKRESKRTSAAAKRRVNEENKKVNVPNLTVNNENASNSDFRYISKDLEQRIWTRDESQCQFIDQLTGKKCGSTYALQIDHIQPYALGGKTTEENLRLLCRAHNLHRTAEI